MLGFSDGPENYRQFTNDVSDGLEEAGRLRTGCVDHSYIRGGDVKGDPNKVEALVTKRNPETNRFLLRGVYDDH